MQPQIARPLGLFALAFCLSHLAIADDNNGASQGGTPTAPLYTDYVSEDGTSARRGNESNWFESIDIYAGTLRVGIPLFNIPGTGNLDFSVQWSANTQEPHANGPHPPRLRTLVTASGGTSICAGGKLPNSNLVLELPDASTWQFYAETVGANSARTTNNWRFSCNGSLTGVLQSPNGNSWDMNVAGQSTFSYTSAAAGSAFGTTNRPDPSFYNTTGGQFFWLMPSAQHDQYGNWVQYGYDGLKLTGMTANDGRQISLSWNGNALTGVASGSRSWLFSQSSTGLLISQPDGQTWTIEEATDWNRVMTGGVYTGAGGLVTAVTNPHGGKTTYTYAAYLVANPNVTCPTAQPDCVRLAIPWVREQPHTALARKQTSDGGTWTYTAYWGNGKAPLATFAPDGPTGHAVRNVQIMTPAKSYQESYQFWSPYEFTTCVSSNTWQIGLLAEKDTGSTQQETYTWINQSMIGGSSGCAAQLGRPLLQTINVIRDGKTYSTNNTYDSYGRATQIVETGDDGNQRVTNRIWLTDTTRWILDRVSSESVGTASSTLSARTYAYNPQGSLTSTTTDGVTHGYGYDGAGNLTSHTDPRGLVTQLGNYYRGVARSEVRPFASGTEPGWCPAPRTSVALTRAVDDFGNVVSLTNARGKTYGYQYDGMNRLVYNTKPAGNPISISWSGSQRTLQRDNYSQTEYFDGYGRTTESVENGIAVNRQFDPLGRMTFQSYPGTSNGDSFDYDQLGRPLTVTHSDGTHQTWGFTGSWEAVTDERGNVTSSIYQAYGNPDEKVLIEVNPPVSGAATLINRNVLGNVTSVVQGSATRTWEYDGHNYLVARTDPETGRTALSRDLSGNLTSRQVGSMPAATYTWDAENRMSSASWSDGVAEQVCKTRDENGNLTTLGSASVTRANAYDDNDNLSSETLIAGGNTLVLQHVFDGDDRLSADVYPDNRRVDYNPDSFGRPTTLGAFGNTISYNARGSVASWTAANSRLTTTTFYDRGWPNQIQVTLAGHPIPAKPIAPTPPGAAPVAPTPPGGSAPVAPGRPSTAEPGAGIAGATACPKAYRAPIAADYVGTNNPTGMLQSDTATWNAKIAACTSDWNNRGVYWSNGDAGCRQTYQEPKLSDYANQNQANARFTDAHKTWQTSMNTCVPQWISKANPWVSYYSAVTTYNSQMAAWQNSQNQYQQAVANYNNAMAAWNAASTKYQQDLATYNAGMAAYNAAVAQNVPAIYATYGYDGVGNIVSISDDSNANLNRTLGYDGLDRLNQADGPWGGGTSLAYDANGNLLKQQLGSYLVNYGYDTQQRLVALAGTKNYSLSYDGWGNVTTRGDGSTWTYDAAGNLRWSNKGAGSQIAYSYDGEGTRAVSVGNGLNRLEFYDHSNQLRFEKNLSSGAIKDYIYLAGQKVADTDGTTTTWYHNDPVGSPVSATDSTGTIVWRNFYHPYGERMLGDGGNTNKQWFGGKTYEDATGLSYFGARWYDPVIGRFMAMDPVDWKESSATHSFNAYGYANNNPLKFTDPNGRDPCYACMFGTAVHETFFNDARARGFLANTTANKTFDGRVDLMNPDNRNIAEIKSLKSVSTPEGKTAAEDQLAGYVSQSFTNGKPVAIGDVSQFMDGRLSKTLDMNYLGSTYEVQYSSVPGVPGVIGYKATKAQKDTKDSGVKSQSSVESDNHAMGMPSTMNTPSAPAAPGPAWGLGF